MPERIMGGLDREERPGGEIDFFREHGTIESYEHNLVARVIKVVLYLITTQIKKAVAVVNLLLLHFKNKYTIQLLYVQKSSKLILSHPTRLEGIKRPLFLLGFL